MDWTDDLADEQGDHDGATVNDHPKEKNAITGDPNAMEFLGENGELPADIMAVWGVSQQSLASARYWVRVWGEAAFRESKVHRMALLEQERNKELSTVRQSYMKKAKK